MSQGWDSKIVKLRPDSEAAASKPPMDVKPELDHPDPMSENYEYRHELHLRDEQIRREIDLREKSFRAEQGIREAALDERLSRMENSVSNATKEIKDFKLWMAGIGVAVVLAIMGANYTLIGSAQGIFDGGKSASANQQRVEALIQESQRQTEENRKLLESLEKSKSPPPAQTTTAKPAT